MVEPISMMAFKERRAADKVFTPAKAMEMTFNVLLLQFRVIAMSLVVMARMTEMVSDSLNDLRKRLPPPPQP